MVVALGVLFILYSLLDWFFHAKEFYEHSKGLIDWVSSNPPSVAQTAILIFGLGCLIIQASFEQWLPGTRYERSRIAALRDCLEPMLRVANFPQQADANEVLNRFREAAGDFVDTNDLGPDIRKLESNVQLLVTTNSADHLSRFGVNLEQDHQRLTDAYAAFNALRSKTRWVIFEPVFRRG